MAKILVTGGAGYIGSHAVRALLKAGFEVVVVDSLVKGHREFVPAGVPFMQADVNEFEHLMEIFQAHKIDAVMHFAGMIEAGLSMTNPEPFFDVNCLGSATLLKVMKISGVKNIVFSSTAAVYGNPVNIPIQETDPLVPTNFYGDTKLFVEKMIQIFANAYDFRFVNLRYFNAAGADAAEGIGEWHDPETHLIANVLKAAKGELPELSLFGTDYSTRDGTCVRDYVHVIDLADAHVLAVKRLLDGGESAVYNLGNGNGFTVKEVIHVAKKVTGVDFKVVEKPRRAGDPAILVADSSKIQAELGWKPQHADLREIVESAWKWAQKM